MRRIILATVTIMMVGLLAPHADAAILTAATCARADVLAAHDAAAAGDTVVVPAGHCTWSSPLTITRALTILGNGGGGYTPTPSSACLAAYTTCLSTDATLQTGLFTTSLSTTSLVRISGFYFDLTPSFGGAAHINYALNFSGTMTHLRVDHNFFHSGKYDINIDARVWGVIDHNYFYNDDASIQVLAGTDGNLIWSEPIVAGMAMGLNTLYIEDNTFVRDEHLNELPNNHLESGHGGQYVLRHNSFDSRRFCAGIAGDNGTCTAGNYTTYMVEQHGNGNYYLGNSSDLRGSTINEVYENLFQGYRVDSPVILRGGSNIVYNNTFTYEYGTTTTVIVAREEEADGSSSFVPQRTVWPAQDQVFNSFFSNNTTCKTAPCSGVVDTDIRLTAGSEIFIQLDRDYFMHMPQSSGGSESFSGRQGGSTTAPTTTDTGLMTFSGSGANAYYPYTPYTYPHPLQGVRTKASFSGDMSISGGVVLQ